jgi:hypothetical protein
MQFEVKRAKVQEDMNKRIQESKKKEELRLKQQEKRLKLMAEERRLKDLQKAALEEAEEAKRREMAKIAFEKERELAEMQARKREEVFDCEISYLSLNFLVYTQYLFFIFFPQCVGP